MLKRPDPRIGREDESQGPDQQKVYAVFASGDAIITRISQAA